MIKLRRQNNTSATEVELGQSTILFSYQTPVAIQCPEGSFKTSTHYSRTTSKHINAWGAKTWSEIEQEELEKLIEKNS
jgi:hypothetical protein